MQVLDFYTFVGFSLLSTIWRGPTNMCVVHFTASSLKDIFESVNNQKIVSFIKDAHFYHQL